MRNVSLSFFSSPEGNVYAVQRVGGVKAVESGFLLLGTGADEVLEYIEVPAEVAVAWRDAAVRVLGSYRPGRSLPAADWKSLAAEADPAWAAEHLGVQPLATPAPSRRVRLATGGND
jgi:hypothetical protein